MLPLDVIRKYYPDLSDEELKEIQEIVYLLSCAVMQHFYGSRWMGGFEELNKKKSYTSKFSSSPITVLG